MWNRIKKGIKRIVQKNKYMAVWYESLSQFKRLLKRYMKYGTCFPRSWIVDSNRKIAYLSIGKVACSSIKACIYEKASEDDYSIHQLVQTTGQNKFGELSSEEENYFKFTFVRNPFDRLVSCYENKYHGDKEKYGHKMLRFDYYLFGYLRKDRGFENFVKKIVKIPSKFMDKLFFIQYDYVYDKWGGCCVDYVGKYENLAEDFQKIQEKYHLKELPHYNVGKKVNWMDYYTMETAELVYNKYKKDIEAFGYEETYHDLIAYLKQKI